MFLIVVPALVGDVTDKDPVLMIAVQPLSQFHITLNAKLMLQVIIHNPRQTITADVLAVHIRM